MGLTELQLHQLAQQLLNENVHAVALTGSFARGDAAADSDLDLVCLVNDPNLISKPEQLHVELGRLVSTTYVTLAHKLRELTQPQWVIHAAPAWQDARVLVDREGALAQLQEAAHAVDWTALRPAAVTYAAEQLTHQVEVALKLIRFMRSGALGQCAVYVLELVQIVAESLAVYGQLQIRSGNEFLNRVSAFVDPESALGRALDRATGRDLAATTLEARTHAALAMYRGAAELLWPDLSPAQQTVIRTALHRLDVLG
jgi:predicted nucleotidyltransferase